MAIIDKSSSGHMLAVAAKGKIATYQTFLGGSLILTLPLAWFMVARGLGFVSVGWAMVVTMTVCAWGRIWFARKLVGMSARYWMAKIMLPMLVVVSIVVVVGYMLHCTLVPGLMRVLTTTVVCECFLLPLTWIVLFDATERLYLSDRIYKLLLK